jgi:hypothetical protein
MLTFRKASCWFWIFLVAGWRLHVAAKPSPLPASPGARAYYDQLRARGTRHRAALRQLGNRLVGILHGCLNRNIKYNEDVTWAQQQKDQEFAA